MFSIISFHYRGFELKFGKDGGKLCNAAAKPSCCDKDRQQHGYYQKQGSGGE